jgi:hypothetical protein
MPGSVLLPLLLLLLSVSVQLILLHMSLVCWLLLVFEQLLLSLYM